MGKLQVTVLGCRDLESKDTFGSSDPYVKLVCAGKTFQTKVIKNNVNPNFNEQFTFYIADPNSEQLKIQVMDSDTFSDDIIGNYSLSIAGLVRGQKTEGWHYLQAPARKGSVGLMLLAEDFGAVGGAVPPQGQPAFKAPPGFPPQAAAGYQAQPGYGQQPPPPPQGFPQYAPPQGFPGMAQGAYQPQGYPPPAQPGYAPQPGYPPQGYPPPQQPGYPGYPPPQQGAPYAPSQGGYGASPYGGIGGVQYY